MTPRSRVLSFLQIEVFHALSFRADELDVRCLRLGKLRRLNRARRSKGFARPTGIRRTPSFSSPLSGLSIGAPLRIVYRREPRRVRVVRVWRSERSLRLPRE
jgi:hypothetical protein